MESLLNFKILLPVVFMLLCIFITLFFCNWYLKRLKILAYPIGGLQWSQIIYAASIFVGCLLILSVIVNPVFQTYKTYLSQRQGFGSLFSSSLGKFTEIFLITWIAMIIYMILAKVASVIIKDKQKVHEEIKAGNIAISILMASVSIGLSIVIKAIVSEVLIYIVPFLINYS
jgi:hypothetical protein